MEEKLAWCLKIKTGIKLTLPSEEEFNSYFSAAKTDLENLIKGKVLARWEPVVAYYSAYYSIYAFLRLLGIKSENHFCSILCFRYVLRVINEDEKMIEVMDRLKRRREEAQYYLKTVKIDVNELKKFIDHLENIKNKVILNREAIRRKIKELIEIVNREEA